MGENKIPNKPKLHGIIRTNLITELEQYYDLQEYFQWKLGSIIQPVHIIGELYSRRDWQGYTRIAYPSSTIQLEDLPEETTVNAAYTKLKTILIGLSGTYTVTFELKRTVAGSANGKVYKNGAAHGTERSENAGNWTGFTENLAFTAGDLLQLYAQAVGGATAHVQELRLKGDTSMGVVRVVL